MASDEPRGGGTNWGGAEMFSENPPWRATLRYMMGDTYTLAPVLIPVDDGPRHRVVSFVPYDSVAVDAQQIRACLLCDPHMFS